MSSKIVTSARTLAESLGIQLAFTRFTINVNLAGIPEAEHLRAPAGGGNCLNWVLGHLVHARNGWLGFLGQPPVIEAERIERYRRGSDPVLDSGADADTGASAAGTIASAELLDAFNRSQEPLLAGLAALTDARLGEPAPFSPGNDPEETLGSLCAAMAFHEAYHAGQLGVIRRTLGIAGAIQ